MTGSSNVVAVQFGDASATMMTCTKRYMPEAATLVFADGSKSTGKLSFFKRGSGRDILRCDTRPDLLLKVQLYCWHDISNGRVAALAATPLRTLSPHVYGCAQVEYCSETYSVLVVEKIECNYNELWTRFVDFERLSHELLTDAVTSLIAFFRVVRCAAVDMKFKFCDLCWKNIGWA